MTHLPKPTDLPKIAGELEKAARWIRDEGERALRATHIDPSRLPVIERERGYGDAPLNAVEAAAVARIPDQWVVERQTHLRANIGSLYDNAVDVIAGIQAINERCSPQQALALADSAPARCCETVCEELASPSHAGRCVACYMRRWRYMQSHDGVQPPQLSVKEVEQRKARQENRKTHVSGPFAERETALVRPDTGDAA